MNRMRRVILVAISLAGTLQVRLRNTFITELITEFDGLLHESDFSLDEDFTCTPPPSGDAPPSSSGDSALLHRSDFDFTSSSQ